MNTTLKQLQVFICIAQEKTITAAASKLFISKPAVSVTLSELEKHLGHLLFERRKNRLIINEQGRLLLPLADEQIERSKVIDNLFNQPNNLSGKLRIGSSDTVGNNVLPLLLSDFRSKTQQKNQSLLINNSTYISLLIKEYELDIGLVEANVFDSELHSCPWLEDEMIIVSSPQHPLVNKQKIVLSDLEDQQWILRETGSGTRNFFLNNIGDKLKRYDVPFELNSTEAIINFTSLDLGITCISAVAARHALNDKRLVQLHLGTKLNINMMRNYWLIWHKDKYQSPLLKQFIDFALQWQITA